MKNRGHSGFTLLELVVVTAVLAIIIAAVVPAFSSAKKHSNESAAVASLRSVSHAQLQYRTRYGNFGEIDELEQATLLDESYEDGEKIGYRFNSAEVPSPSTWSVSAAPVTPGVTGDRYFYIDESGVIRYRDGEAAGENDAAVD